MDLSLLLWVTFALLVFWCVGLYNRLMRLRARGIEVLLALERHALTCTDLVNQHLASRTSLEPGELGLEWKAVLQAAQNLSTLLRAPHQCALDAAALAPFSAAWEQLRDAWQTTVDQHGDLAGPVVPLDLMQAWDAASLKVRVVQGGYAQIVDRYNESINEFPARLLAGLLGFAPAGHFST
jgi:LemA protein